MTPGTLSEYVPRSWFHPKGIYKVVADLMPRLPDVSGCLFLTFTIDPLNFSGPESAFEHSRALLRKLFYKLRRGVEWEDKRFKIDSPYCVKVEFHENGWPHFHVIFLTKHFLPGPLLNELWGLGRTNVKRISNKKFHYLLKYVAKGGDVPEWVLARPRIRIFQTSRGFYAVPRESSPNKQNPKEPVKKRQNKATIGERLENWRRVARFQYGASRCRSVYLRVPFSEMLGEIALPVARDGRYLGLGQIRITSGEEFFQLEQYIL